MKLVPILACLSLAGCYDGSSAKAMEEVMRNCAKPASIELRLSKFSSEIVVRCDEVGKAVTK